METANIVDFARRDGMSDALTELLKPGGLPFSVKEI